MGAIHEVILGGLADLGLTTSLKRAMRFGKFWRQSMS